jgi:hypothetical protein
VVRPAGRTRLKVHVPYLLDRIDEVEREVLERLSAWRLRGSTGRRNEWLAGISATEVERIALAVLAQSGFEVRGIDPAFWQSFAGAGPDKANRSAT